MRFERHLYLIRMESGQENRILSPPWVLVGNYLLLLRHYLCYFDQNFVRLMNVLHCLNLFEVLLPLCYFLALHQQNPNFLSNYYYYYSIPKYAHYFSNSSRQLFPSVDSRVKAAVEEHLIDDGYCYPRNTQRCLLNSTKGGHRQRMSQGRKKVRNRRHGRN